MKLPIGRSVACGILAVLWLTEPGAARQKGAILGEVYDAMDGRPLAKVVVSIPGTKIRAVTDTLGVFRLENVEPGDVLVRLEMSGYAGTSESIVVDAGWTSGVTFELAPVAILLDALRVRAGGTPLNAQIARTGDTVRPDDGTTGSAADRLGSHVAGVLVMRPNGEVGTGTRIMIRGPTSISLSNLPAVYVDGVRVQGEMMGIRREGLLTLDFIPAETIERIDVLKGPTAAAKYGPASANGVILIYTKRGGGSK